MYFFGLFEPKLCDSSDRGNQLSENCLSLQKSLNKSRNLQDLAERVLRSPKNFTLKIPYVVRVDSKLKSKHCKSYLDPIELCKIYF